MKLIFPVVPVFFSVHRQFDERFHLDEVPEYYSMSCMHQRLLSHIRHSPERFQLTLQR